MDNHYHLIVRFSDPEDVDRDEAMERWNVYHANTLYCRNRSLEQDREYVVSELTDISSFMKRLNLHLTKTYNREKREYGTLWESRFRSVVVEGGWALVNCAAYVELNSFRASVVKKPEDYEFSSLGLLRRADRRELIDIELLDEGLGVRERFGRMSDKRAYTREVYQAYLAFVYEAGTRPGRRGESMVTNEAMRKRLRRYDIQAEKGSFVERVALYTRSRFAGEYESVMRWYERFLTLGYKGEARKRHVAKWAHALVNGLWGLMSIGVQRRETWKEKRGSP